MRWRFSTLEIILLLLVVAGSGMAYAWVVYGGGGLINLCALHVHADSRL